MATLSSSSTYQQVLDAWDDGVSYQTDNDTAKAQKLIEAGLILLRHPQRCQCDEEVRE